MHQIRRGTRGAEPDRAKPLPLPLAGEGRGEGCPRHTSPIRALLKLRTTHLLRDRRGNVALITALALPAFIGVMGFGIEVSNWSGIRIELQRTADLAAMAGALKYASTADAQASANSAANLAELNGISGAATRTWNGTTQKLTDNLITAQIVGGLRHAGDKAVMATVQRPVPLSFSRIMVRNGQQSVTISATSWAEIGPGTGGQPCVLALQGDDTGIETTNDISISGNARITFTNCTMRSDASITMSGNASVNVLSGIYAAGAVSVSGSVNLQDPTTGRTSPIYTNSGQIPDPLKADVALQNAFTTLSQAQSGTTGLTPQTIPDMKPNKTAPTLQPGVYNGSMQVQGTATFGSGSPGTYVINGNLSFGAQANATLGPGLYVVNGSVDFGSNGTVTGNGVTIVAAGAVTNNGGSTVNLSAPVANATVGAPGVLFATRESGTDNKWNGGTSQTLAGAIYAPNSLVQINGNAGLPPDTTGAGCLEVIAYNVKVTGTANMASNCSAFGSALTFTSVPGVVALVQ